MFGFWAGQNLKLRSTSFGVFKSSLVVNFGGESLPLSKTSTSIFCLSKGAHLTTTSGQSSWGT